MLNIAFMLIFLFSYIQSTECNKKIDILFVSYSNPHHTTADSKCCQIETSDCRHKCENEFDVCITDPSIAAACNYAKVETEAFYYDVFGFHLGLENKLQNPVEKLLNVWPEKLDIKIEVYNIVSKRRDLVARFNAQLHVLQNIQAKIYQQEFNMSSGDSIEVKKLDLKVTKSCIPNYVLPDCSKLYCVPQDNATGHYTCDKKTGEKNCLDGWMNVTSDCIVENITTTTASPSTTSSSTTTPDIPTTQMTSTKFDKIVPTKESSTNDQKNDVVIKVGVAIGCIAAIAVIIVIAIVMRRRYKTGKYEAF